MLVLERKIGEEIIIDDNIFIGVVTIKNKIIKLTFSSKKKFFIVNVTTDYVARKELVNFWNDYYKVNDVILINSNIKIMIVRVTGQQRARLGFEAPKHIKILRKELENE